MDGIDGGDAGGLDGSGDGAFGFGFDTDFGGVDGIDGSVGGASTDFAADCLMSSYDFCEAADCDMGSVDFGDVGFDSLNSERASRPLSRDQLTEEQARKLAELENDPMRTFFGAHVAGHGYIDLPCVFKRLAAKHNCHRIDPVASNFDGMEMKLDEISDWNRWTPPFTRERVPRLWYKGAVGSTHIIRQYWQVKKKLAWLEKDPYPGQRYDQFANVVLQVVMITWQYQETGDFETRFQIRVVPLLEWSGNDRSWGIRRTPFERHQKAARQLSDAMLEEMKKVKPTEASVLLRKIVSDRIESEEKNKPAPSPAPSSECETGTVVGANVLGMLLK